MIGRAPSASRVERYAAEAAAAHDIAPANVIGTGRTVAFVCARCVI